MLLRLIFLEENAELYSIISYVMVALTIFKRVYFLLASAKLVLKINRLWCICKGTVIVSNWRWL